MRHNFVSNGLTASARVCVCVRACSFTCSFAFERSFSLVYTASIEISKTQCDEMNKQKRRKPIKTRAPKSKKKMANGHAHGQRMNEDVLNAPPQFILKLRTNERDTHTHIEHFSLWLTLDYEFSSFSLSLYLSVVLKLEKKAILSGFSHLASFFTLPSLCLSVSLPLCVWCVCKSVRREWICCCAWQFRAALLRLKSSI